MSLFKKKPYDPDSSLGNMLWVSTLGIHLVLTSVVGFFIGHFIDGKAHTAPVFTLLFFVLGMVGGFREIFRQLQSIDKKEQSRKNDPKEE